MTRITITVDGITTDLPDAAIPGLDRQVALYNLANKTVITLADWIPINLSLVAIADDMAAAIDQLRKQHETDANAALETAIKTARDELIAALAAPAVAGSGPE